MTIIIYGDFHDSLTGEMVTRELTLEEIAELPEAQDDLADEVAVADVEPVDEE